MLTPKFFEEHWEKAPLHWRAAEHGKEGNLLPKAMSVDDVIALVRLSGSSLKMFKKGESCNLDNFLLAYLDGASLIVNQADRVNATLYELCRTLAKRHFFHAFAVVYLTPPHSQAVRLHNDDQDVILLQVWGRKRWKIRPAPQALPYTEEMLGKDKPVAEELIKPAIMEFDMEPHDVLYIPRGFLHEADTGLGEHSLHVTITVPTSDYCWGVQLVKNMMKKLSSPDMADRHVLDTSLGKAGDTGGFDDSKLQEHLQGIVQKWVAGVSVDGVLDSFEERMARTNEGQERQLERNMALHPPACVTEDSRVRLMYGVTSWVDDDGELAVFSRGQDGQKLELPITPAAAPVIRALTSLPQRVVDLPLGTDGFERMCVLQMLHMQGVVQLFLDPPVAPTLNDDDGSSTGAAAAPT